MKEENSKTDYSIKEIVERRDVYSFDIYTSPNSSYYSRTITITHDKVSNNVDLSLKKGDSQTIRFDASEQTLNNLIEILERIKDSIN